MKIAVSQLVAPGDMGMEAFADKAKANAMSLFDKKKEEQEANDKKRKGRKKK